MFLRISLIIMKKQLPFFFATLQLKLADEYFMFSEHELLVMNLWSQS